MFTNHPIVADLHERLGLKGDQVSRAAFLRRLSAAVQDAPELATGHAVVYRMCHGMVTPKDLPVELHAHAVLVLGLDEFTPELHSGLPYSLYGHVRDYAELWTALELPVDLVQTPEQATAARPPPPTPTEIEDMSLEEARAALAAFCAPQPQPLPAPRGLRETLDAAHADAHADARAAADVGNATGLRRSVRLARRADRQLGGHDPEAPTQNAHFQLAFQKDPPKSVGDIGEGQRSREVRDLEAKLQAARASMLDLHAPWLRNVTDADPLTGAVGEHAPPRLVYPFALSTTYVSALAAAIDKDAAVGAVVDKFVDEVPSYAYAVEPGSGSPLTLVLSDYRPGGDEVTMRFGARGIMRMRALLKVLPVGQTPTWLMVLPLIEKYAKVTLVGDYPNVDSVGPVIAWLFDQMAVHIGLADRHSVAHDVVRLLLDCVNPPSSGMRPRYTLTFQRELEGFMCTSRMYNDHDLSRLLRCIATETTTVANWRRASRSNGYDSIFAIQYGGAGGGANGGGSSGSSSGKQH